MGHAAGLVVAFRPTVEGVLQRDSVDPLSWALEAEIQPDIKSRIIECVMPLGRHLHLVKSLTPCCVSTVLLNVYWA